MQSLLGKSIGFGILSLFVAHGASADLGQLGGGQFLTGITSPGTAVYGIPASPVSIIVAIMKGLLALIGAGAIIMFAVAGIMYMTSAGDEDQAKRAKKTATYALLGLIVALGGMVVIQAVTTILAGRSNF